MLFLIVGGTLLGPVAFLLPFGVPLCPPVIEGKIAVTIVALVRISALVLERSTQYRDLRRRTTNTESHPCNQQLRIHIPSLNQHHQAHTHNTISQKAHPPHTQPIRHNTPNGTCNQRYKLVREAERADEISNVRFYVQEVGNHEGDAGVEEDEEGDTEEAGSEEVGGGLEGGDAGREGEVAR